MLVLFFAGQAMAVLTKHPKSFQIFSGESVTLRCNIQTGKVTDWKYTWSKDDVDSISRKHEYEISEIKTSDNGEAFWVEWCSQTYSDIMHYYIMYYYILAHLLLSRLLRTYSWPLMLFKGSIPIKTCALWKENKDDGFLFPESKDVESLADLNFNRP